MDGTTIAKLLNFDLTRTVRLSDIPKNRYEYGLKQTLSKYEGVDICFNLAETEADIHFLDIYWAGDSVCFAFNPTLVLTYFKAYTDLKTTGGTAVHFQVVSNDYIFPERYMPEVPEAIQAVVFSEFLPYARNS